MLTMGVGSVMTFMMNKLLIAIEATATAAAVFGAYFKLQSFFNMPVLGLSQGMSPIVGFNLGAKNKHRMLETYRLSVRVALLIMCLAAAAFLLIPDVLLKLFNASPFMLEIGEPAFRIIAVSFIFSAYGIVTSQFFYGLRKEPACPAHGGCPAACYLSSRRIRAWICVWIYAGLVGSSDRRAWRYGNGCVWQSPYAKKTL